MFSTTITTATAAAATTTETITTTGNKLPIESIAVIVFMIN